MEIVFKSTLPFFLLSLFSRPGEVNHGLGAQYCSSAGCHKLTSSLAGHFMYRKSNTTYIANHKYKVVVSWYVFNNYVTQTSFCRSPKPSSKKGWWNTFQPFTKQEYNEFCRQCVSRKIKHFYFSDFFHVFWSKSCLQCSLAVKSMDLPKCKSLVGSKYSTRYFGRSADPIQSQEIRRSSGALQLLKIIEFWVPWAIQSIRT